MKPKWQKLASLAHEICTLLFQFFGAVFASKGYPFKNIFLLQWARESEIKLIRLFIIKLFFMLRLDSLSII